MSISSSEGNTLPGDLSSKYQKLATEYAKVRAQVSVLKKAVVEEQALSTGLKEQIFTKDQTLRKHYQEIDSLTFRNQQLTRRVTILQEELDCAQANGKKSRIKKEAPLAVDDNSIFQEELHKKIKDNERLVHLLQEERDQLEQEREQWRDTKTIYERLLKEKDETKLCSCNKPVNKTEFKTSCEKNVYNASDTRQLSNADVKNKINSFHDLLVHMQRLFLACAQDEALDGSQNYLALPDSCLVLGSLETFIRFYNDEKLMRYDTCVRGMLSDIVNCLKRFVTALASHAENDPVLYVPLDDCLKSLTRILKDNFNILCNAENSVGHLERSHILHCITKLEQYCQCVLEPNHIAGMSQINSDNCFTSCTQCLMLAKRLKCLEEEISKKSQSGKSVLSQHIFSTTHTEADKQEHANSYTLECKFGRVTALTESLCQDPAVKQFIDSKVHQVIYDRLSAEGKVTRLMGEKDATQSRLEECVAELKCQTNLASQLQEELSTTARNYEDQLSSMSEHMANMNDRLTAQQTHIEQLTYQLQTKDNKRGWNK